MKPKISFITITFNWKETVAEAIESVIAQNYSNLEYIVVDGLSTDGTVDIIKNYSQHISRFVSEKDEGISDAFNKGISFATGDIIGILNADDVMLPGALDAMAEAFDGKTDIYRGNIRIWNPKTDNQVREFPSMEFKLMPINVHVAHPGTFITPAAYKKWGVYRKDMRFAMDLELLCRHYRGGAVLKYVPVDVALYRIGGVTDTPLSIKKTEMKTLIKLNGGSSFLANVYYARMVVVDIAKRIIVKCFGEDFKRKLRYKRIK